MTSLKITPAAIEEVKKFMIAENVPDTGGVRIGILPGGCSGFKYNLLVEDAPIDDDEIIESGDIKIFVDPFSSQYINDVEVDFVSTFQGSGFTFKNPNATGGCGCNQSFSV